MRGGVCVLGACMVGVHSWWGWEHEWQGVVHGGACVQEGRPLKQLVSILLECFFFFRATAE